MKKQILKKEKYTNSTQIRTYIFVQTKKYKGKYL